MWCHRSCLNRAIYPTDCQTRTSSTIFGPIRAKEEELHLCSEEAVAEGACTAGPAHAAGAAQGYLAALSASAYSFVSMVQRFGPIMNPGGAAISLTYLASERIIPGAGQRVTDLDAPGSTWPCMWQLPPSRVLVCPLQTTACSREGLRCKLCEGSQVCQAHMLPAQATAGA